MIVRLLRLPPYYMYQNSDDGNALSTLKDANEDKRPRAKSGAEGLLSEGETWILVGIQSSHYLEIVRHLDKFDRFVFLCSFSFFHASTASSPSPKIPIQQGQLAHITSWLPLWSNHIPLSPEAKENWQPCRGGSSRQPMSKLTDRCIRRWWWWWKEGDQ